MISLVNFARPLTGPTVGSPSDGPPQEIAAACGAGDPATFTGGICPSLIDCMMKSLEPAATAGFQSGTNIAALDATILALIGTYASARRASSDIYVLADLSSVSPRLDLVQLAFTSPHRAVAIYLFSIGLPTGLFRQLQSKLKLLSDRNPDYPLERVWSVPVGLRNHSDARRVMSRLAADIAILGLAGVILWSNYRVGRETMVTWRCEYYWLVFCWYVHLLC